MKKLWGKALATIAAWKNLVQNMPNVEKAFNKVRNELCEVGLLKDTRYLDRIELIVSPIPSFGESGYVFEKLPSISRLFSYEEGVIYLPSTLPRSAYVPGGTLTDTIRHEFAHAWHWLDPGLFNGDWFVETFGSKYEAPYCNNSQECMKLFDPQHYVSEYAVKSASENFAETFMFYLRYRNSLGRFKNRRGVLRKLRAVSRAVKMAKKKNGL